MESRVGIWDVLQSSEELLDEKQKVRVEKKLRKSFNGQAINFLVMISGDAAKNIMLVISLTRTMIYELRNDHITVEMLTFSGTNSIEIWIYNF